MTDIPIIGITMGDPAGVGPEVVLKALQRPRVQSAARYVVIGDQTVLDRAASSMNLKVDLETIREPDQIDDARSGYLLQQPPILRANFPTACIDPQCGRAALNYINCAVDLALHGRVDAIATAPINKAALQAAGSPFIGHTELLAARCQSDDIAMMLVTPGRAQQPQWLRVTHATTHIPLKDVALTLSIERILKTVEVTVKGLELMGIEAPRLALAAFNPHASDEGLMGDEEARILIPAVELALERGHALHGPIPADTVFLRALNGEYDAVVTLYHDQGHIPVKTHGFERAVNVTLGLPIIRTSVDHGTAFDIAWRGLANEASMVEAIVLAAQISMNRKTRSKHAA